MFHHLSVKGTVSRENMGFNHMRSWFRSKQWPSNWFYILRILAKSSCLISRKDFHSILKIVAHWRRIVKIKISSRSTVSLHRPFKQTRSRLELTKDVQQYCTVTGFEKNCNHYGKNKPSEQYSLLFIWCLFSSLWILSFYSALDQCCQVAENSAK